MAHRTITALYDSKAAAEDAKSRLSAIGVGSVDIHDQGSLGSTSGTAKAGGMVQEIKHLFGGHEDTHAYAEGLQRGHILLSAKVDDDQTDEAIRVLEGSGAVDFDRSQSEWKREGWTAPTTGDQTIELAEERLVVGKREVERGGVRVRSYVVETPVSEQVSLRKEHIDIERRAVDRAVTGSDAFKDQTIEMHETDEEAVVGKQTIVKEEMVIRKEVGERTEEVRDTVRHTEVEVERTPGEPLGGASKPRI